MLPKFENKTQTGTLVYIVMLIINCSTYVYNIIIYSSKCQLNVACQQSPCRAAVRHGTEHVSDAYSTVSTHLSLHFILKNHAKSKLDSNFVINLWVMEQILTHNRSKFVLSKLVLTGVCCTHFMYIHVCTVRVRFLVCTWSVCLPTLSSDFYLTSKIPTIFF